MDLNADQIALVRDIRDFATEHGLPSLLLVALAFLENESFNDADESGDHGNAFGLFQMNIRVWGIPWHRWHGREGTRKSMETMVARWQGAYVASPLVFEDDPAGFLLGTWKAMQGGSATLTIAKTRRAITSAEAALAEAGEERQMVAAPPIKWIGCSPHNFIVGRPANVGFEAIFEHTTAGSTYIEDLDGWFNGTHYDRNGVLIRGSTQLGIGLSRVSGKVECHQYVRFTDTPIAQGQRAGYTSGELFDENPGISANVWGIGKEHMDGGIPGNHSAEILEMSAWVDAWLFETVLFKSTARPTPVVSRRHILGHYQADGRDRPFCPSWPESRYTAHIERVKALLAGVPEPPLPDPFPPDPGPDWAATYRRLLDEVGQWQIDDAVGAEARAARLHALREVK